MTRESPTPEERAQMDWAMETGGRIASGFIDAINTEVGTNIDSQKKAAAVLHALSLVSAFMLAKTGERMPDRRDELISGFFADIRNLIGVENGGGTLQ